MLALDVLELLLVIPSSRWVEYEDANWWYVIVHELDELSYASRLCSLVKRLRMKAQVLQSHTLSFKEQLTRLTRVTHSGQSTTTLELASDIEGTYNSIWRTTNNIRQLDLKQTNLCRTNIVVDGYSNKAVEALPGSVFNQYLGKTVEAHSSFTDPEEIHFLSMLCHKRH